MSFLFITLKHKRDGRFLEKGCGENLENCVERMRESQLFFDDGDQNINGHSNPDLGLHAIGRCAKKTFDTQMLFDPFEEQFYLPTLAINRGDCKSRKKEIVSQEHEACIDFFRIITDPS